MFQPGSRPHHLHSLHSQRARTETKGFFHLPKMGCVLPSLPATKMTLKRARRGVKTCIWEAAGSSACISSLATLLPGSFLGFPRSITALYPHALMEGSKAGRSCNLLTAACSPLSLIVDRRALLWRCVLQKPISSPWQHETHLSTIWPTYTLGPKAQWDPG